MICIKVEYGLYESRFCSLVVECSVHHRMVVGSHPVEGFLRREFHCLAVKVSADPSTGPGFDPRQEYLLMKEIGKILSQSTFGSPDKTLATSSRGMMCMLYMYCERAVQKRQDVCAVHRRTASLQYDGVLYIQDGTCCTYKTTSRQM